MRKLGVPYEEGYEARANAGFKKLKLKKLLLRIKSRQNEI
jgi:hypothetical protein